MNRINKTGFLLLIAFLLELSFFTFFQGKFGWFLSPIIYLLVNAFIAFYPIYLLVKYQELAEIPVSTIKIPIIKVGIVLLVLSVGLIFYMKHYILSIYPIELKYSDIIPAMKVYVSRFLNHQYVYALITEFGYEMYPTYLPCTWGAFILPDILHFDYRLMALLILLFSLVFYTRKVLLTGGSSTDQWLKMILPYFSILLLFIYLPFDMGATVEIFVLGYYIFLAYSITGKSNLLKGLAIVLCLLSRYSLILWLPLLFLMLFYRNKKDAIIAGSVVFIGVLLLYIIPYLSADWQLFTKGVGKYVGAASAEWSGQWWQKPGDMPIQLSRGFGFAIYFYKWLSGDLIYKITMLKNAQLITSLLTVGALTIAYFWKFKNYVTVELYALLSLKFTLAVFYSFVLVPYIYMFIPTLGASFFILQRYSIFKS